MERTAPAWTAMIIAGAIAQKRCRRPPPPPHAYSLRPNNIMYKKHIHGTWLRSAEWIDNLSQLESSLPFMFHNPHISWNSMLTHFQCLYLPFALTLFSSLSLFIKCFYFIRFHSRYDIVFLLFKMTLKLILTWYESKSQIVNGIPGAARWTRIEINVLLTFYILLNKQLNNQLGHSNFQKWIEMEENGLGMRR